MINATDLKNGATFLMDENPYVVVKYTHQKIARSAGTVKLSVRNLLSGKLEDKTLSSTSKVDQITTQKRTLQYLYNDTNSAVFMDEKSFNQVEIPIKLAYDSLKYIKEGEKVNILFWDDKPLSIDIAAKVTLKVKDTAPGVKGNSATNIFKPAVLENGLTLKVPLFIKNGDEIRVDTKTGEYIERAKS